MAGAIVAAAFVKGSIAFGFPAVATPLLALATDMQTAVAVSIVPNIVMDGTQAFGRGGFVATVKRLWVMLVFGLIGTFVGTHLLVSLSPKTAGAVLGCFLLFFVAWNASGVAPTVSRRWERLLAVPVGFAAGVLGGVTNVPGTPMVVYFYALRMEKDEFIRSVGFCFMLYKAIQFIAVIAYGLMTWPLFLASFGLTAVAMAGFLVGMKVRDALPPKIFNRAILGFLTLLAISLIIRAFR